MPAPQPKPKWVDPDSWGDDDQATVIDIRPELSIDRFHNHEDLSPEGLAKAISDLKESVEALDSRLNVAEEGASGAAHAAKDLGVSMVKMGDALSKRVKLLEDSAAAIESAAGAAAHAAAAEATAQIMELAAQKSAAEKAASAAAAAPLFVAAKPPAKNRRMLYIGGAIAALVVAAAGALVVMKPATPHAAAPAQMLYAPSGR
jgi:hypothetical protein